MKRTKFRNFILPTFFCMLIGCGKSDSDVAASNTYMPADPESKKNLMLFNKHGYSSAEAALKKGGFINPNDVKEILSLGFSTRAAYEEALLINIKKQYEANGGAALYGTDSCRLARADYSKTSSLRDKKWNEHWRETLSAFCLTGEFDPDAFYSITYLPAKKDKCGNRSASEPDAAYREYYEYSAMRRYFNLLDALSPRQNFFQNVNLDHLHLLNLQAEDGGFCPNGIAAKAFEELSLLDQPKKKNEALEKFKKLSKSIASDAGVTTNQQLVALQSTAEIEMVTPVSSVGEYRFLISMKPIIHQGHQGETQIFYSGGSQCRYRFNNLPSKDVFEFSTKSEAAARKIEKIIRQKSTTANTLRMIDLLQYQGIYYSQNDLMVTIYGIVDELEKGSCTVVLKAQAIEIATVNPQDPINGKSEQIVIEQL